MNARDLIVRFQQSARSALIFHFAIFMFLIALPAASRGADAEPEVGTAFELKKLRFIGNATFTAEQLRAGLESHPSYLLAAHPREPRKRLLAVLENSIRRGYLQMGFPDATVAVLEDATAHVPIVTIVEGPRFTQGDLRFENVPPLFAERLNQKLNSAAASHSFQKPAVGLSNKWTRLIVPPSPYSWWEKGKPFSFVPSSDTTNDLSAAIWDLGFVNAKFATREVRTNSNRIDRVISLDGPAPSPIADLEIEGIKANSKKEIVEFLGLTFPLSWAALDLEALEKKLWRSGRFHDFDLSVVRSESNSTPRLVLHCEESPLLPPLAQPFNREQQAILNFGRWLEEMSSNHIDLVAEVTLTAPMFKSLTVDVILAGTGASYAIRGLDGVGTPLRLLLTSNMIASAFSENRQKIFTPLSAQRLWAAVGLFPSGHPEQQRYIAIEAGFHSGHESEPLFSTRFVFFPATLIETFLSTEWTRAWSGEILTCTTTNGFWSLRVNAETGELLEMKFDDPATGRGAVRAARGSFQQAAKQFQGVPVAFSERPVSNLAALAALWVEDLSARQTIFTNPPPALLKQIARVAGNLVEAGAFITIDRAVRSTADWGRKEQFSIPLDSAPDPKSMLDQIVTWGLAMFSKLVRDAFPADSWPVVLTRETVFLKAGQTKYARAELERLYQSTEPGPIGCGLIAAFLTQLRLQGGDDFAALGLRRLSFEAFQKDWDFLRSSPLFDPMLKDFNQALAKISEPERAVVKGILSPRLEALLLNSGTNSVEQLKEIWEFTARAGLEKALQWQIGAAERALSPELVLGRAADALQHSRFPDAVKWLRLAEGRGHPHAAFLLGSCYEAGKGVERDSAAAVRYYESAANAGHPDAQYKLGFLLSDAFFATPDYPRAFLWLTLAERRGNKAAAATKMGVQRRLLPEQIAALNAEALDLEKKINKAAAPAAAPETSKR